MSDSARRVLTIGHSTLSIEAFLTTLERSGVTAVADVRSSPVSQRMPHFSRNDLSDALRAHGIKYVFLGEELGGRPRASTLYCDGVADYERMAAEPKFLKGVERVISGANDHTVALMCSEHNPLDCHRCLLVGRALSERDVQLGHILNDGTVVDHSDMEEKLLALAGNAEADMFSDRNERLTRAYRLRSRNVAYRQAPTEIAEPASANWYEHVS